MDDDVKELVDRVRGLLKAATPGPWRYDGMEYVFGSDDFMISDSGWPDPPRGAVQQIRGHGAEVSGHRPEGSQDANAELIAAAPTLLAQQADALDRLAADNARLRELVAQITPWLDEVGLSDLPGLISWREAARRALGDD
jgi:hypothetical protein